MTDDASRERAVPRPAGRARWPDPVEDRQRFVRVRATHEPVGADRQGSLDGAQLVLGPLGDDLEEDLPPVGAHHGGQVVQLRDGQADVLEPDVAEAPNRGASS